MHEVQHESAYTSLLIFHVTLKEFICNISKSLLWTCMKVERTVVIVLILEFGEIQNFSRLAEQAG